MSTEPSLRYTSVRLFKGMVRCGFCEVGAAETRRGTTARTVAREKCILSRLAELKGASKLLKMDRGEDGLTVSGRLPFYIGRL